MGEAVRRIEADANRSADTHLRVVPLPVNWGIDLYLKDESVHPTQCRHQCLTLGSTADQPEVESGTPQGLTASHDVALLCDRVLPLLR